jgi:hypothetical protein
MYSVSHNYSIDWIMTTHKIKNIPTFSRLNTTATV